MEPSETAIKGYIRRYLKGIPNSKFVSYTPFPYGEPGTPDIIGCIEGKMFLFEVKTKKGKLSLLQKQRIEEWIKAGGEVYTVRSTDDVKKALKQEKNNAK